MKINAKKVFETPYINQLLALVLLCIVLSFLSERFLTFSNFLNIFKQSSVLAILAIGMTFVILTGGIDLSVGSILALVGVITASLLAGGHNMMVAIMVGLIVGLVFGLANGFFVSFFDLPPFIVTLATMAIARGFTLVYTSGYPISTLPETFDYLGMGKIAGFPFIILLTLVTFILFYFLLTKTSFGKYIYAVGDNKNAAILSGINVNLVLLLVYSICGLLSGFSGILLTSRLGSAQPTAGFGYELDAIACVVLGGTNLFGGRGSLIGTMIGVLIIGVITNGLNLLGVSSFIQQIIKGVILLLAILFSKRK
jgi:Ribose/xylose/arabinose/galactoside ABC-type transport systems, permease components